MGRQTGLNMIFDQNDFKHSKHFIFFNIERITFSFLFYFKFFYRESYKDLPKYCHILLVINELIVYCE